MTKILFYTALMALLMPLQWVKAADNVATDIEKIDKAWGEVTQEYNAFLARIQSIVAEGDATERYNAYKTAMAMFVDMYTGTIYRYSSPDYPETLPFGTPITNSCSNNMGNRYVNAYIEPGASYRVWGTRGNALELDVQQFRSFAGVGEAFPIAATGEFSQKTFSAQGINIDKEGRFEFILSSTKPSKGQWWKLEDGTRVLQLRDFYADYSEEAIPPVYHFEKLGQKDMTPTTISSIESAERLQMLAKSLKSWDICFRVGGAVPMHDFTKKIFYANPDDKTKGVAEQVNQTYYLSQFNLLPGQALVVEWQPPEDYLFWNIELNTRIGQYLNFGARQVDLTGKMSHIDPDGKIRFVLSHEDPHVANWLDLDGITRGLIWLRCKICSVNGIPSAKVVKVDELSEYLPKGSKMVTDKERQHELELRRRHFQSRYRL